MRIGLFVLMAGRNAGGPETYEVELLRALARIDQRNEYIVYHTTPKARESIGVEQANFSWTLLKPHMRVISVGLTLPVLTVRDGLDMYHATFTPAPVSARPLVFTMHCVSSLVHPEFYKRATALRLNYLLRTGMSKARHILCVSRTTMQHLEEMYGISRERMSVAYNGVTPGFAPVPQHEALARMRKSIGVDEPYFLCLGKLQAHKNIERLIRAFHMFRQETGSRIKLVVAGRAAGNAVEPAVLAKELGIEKDIVRPGYVAQEDLPALYSAARAFIFPSLWEGFGIPVLEAMSCGTPVISSNATCLPEIAGGAALLVDPTSIESIAAALARIDGSADERQAFINAGFARAKDFSWDKCAASSLRAYENVKDLHKS